MKWTIAARIGGLVLLGLVSTACGDLPTADSARIEETVGPAGRPMAFENLELIIPEGALDSEVTIVIYKTADTPKDNIGPAYGIKVKTNGAWHEEGFEFAMPVELVYHLPLAEAPEDKEYDSLRLAWVIDLPLSHR